MTSEQANRITIKSLESDCAEKRTDVITRHRSLFARKAFVENEVIEKFYWTKIHAKPSYLTVQISDTEHIELMPEYLECVNHSCEPNCFFDTKRQEFIALRPITAGEEFTFFYPSSEWDMDQSFQCNCGSPICLGLIKGAKYLPVRLLKNYRYTEYIEQKLKKERGQEFVRSTPRRRATGSRNRSRL